MCLTYRKNPSFCIWGWLEIRAWSAHLNFSWDNHDDTLTRHFFVVSTLLNTFDWQKHLCDISSLIRLSDFWFLRWCTNLLTGQILALDLVELYLDVPCHVQYFNWLDWLESQPGAGRYLLMIYSVCLECF